MDPHPLRGHVRWLVFPALSIAAGALAGLLWDAYHASETFLVTALGGVLAGAAALGVAVSSRAWIGQLVAPPVGALGIAVAKYQGREIRGLWRDVAHELRSEPGLVFVVFALTGPLIALHWHRLRRPGGVRGAGGLYAAAAGGVWVLIGLVSGKFEPVGLLFLGSFYLGNLFALERSAATRARP